MPAPPPPGEADPNVTAWHYYVTVALPPLTLLLLAVDWVQAPPRDARARMARHGPRGGEAGVRRRPRRADAHVPAAGEVGLGDRRRQRPDRRARCLAARQGARRPAGMAHGGCSGWSRSARGWARARAWRRWSLAAGIYAVTMRVSVGHAGRRRGADLCASGRRGGRPAVARVSRACAR